MAQFAEQNTLDYRAGGDTVDDAVQKYMKEMPRIYQFLNNIREHNSDGPNQVEPQPFMFKVTDGKMYIRNAENTEWIFLFDIKYRMGLVENADSEIMTSDDVAEVEPGTVTREANKLVMTNGNGILPVDILGNCGKMAGYNIEVNNLSDGQVFTYRAASNSWRNEDKGVVGAGKALAMYDGETLLFEYSGDAPQIFDTEKTSIKDNITSLQGDVTSLQGDVTSLQGDVTGFFRQPSTAYEIDDVKYSPLLKSYQRLECVTAGTTSSGDLDVTSSTTGQYIQDGTVKWIVTDVRDGDMVGDISFHHTLLAGHIKANRAAVTASDYPRLLAWVQDNGMLTTDTTDESKYQYDSVNDELVVPNAVGRVLQGGNTVGTKEAGLPNIKGKVRASTSMEPFSPANTEGNLVGEGALEPLADGYYTYNWSEANGGGCSGISFDASRSNAIYSDSVTTVQTPALTLIPQIKY